MYSNIPYNEKLDYDILKENVAIEKGFDHYYVFSDEDLLNKQKEFLYIINNKLDKIKNG